MINLHDHDSSAKVKLAEVIATELGIQVQFRQRDIDKLERDVELAVKANETRLHPSWKTRRAYYRA
jgi:polysaccharide deacetylase 2 family uncharacterized protein YibQ